MESYDYIEETIFGKMGETLAAQEVEITFDVEQPWGDSRVRLRYNSFVNDLSKYSTSVFGNLSFRVVRGLSVFASASTELGARSGLPVGEEADRRGDPRRAAAARHRFAVPRLVRVQLHVRVDLQQRREPAVLGAPSRGGQPRRGGER